MWRTTRHAGEIARGRRQVSMGSLGEVRDKVDHVTIISHLVLGILSYLKNGGHDGRVFW
jgi:hypothetical protein